MARYEFGGGAADFVTAPITTDRLFRAASATLTVYLTRAGGAAVTDLLLGGVPVTTIPVGANGQIPTFTGPDGVTTLWASASGGDRIRLLSPTVLEQAAAAGAAGSFAKDPNDPGFFVTAPSGTGGGTTVTDNGDGTFTISGDGVVDNADGTYTIGA